MMRRKIGRSKKPETRVTIEPVLRKLNITGKERMAARSATSNMPVRYPDTGIIGRNPP